MKRIGSLEERIAAGIRPFFSFSVVWWVLWDTRTTLDQLSWVRVAIVIIKPTALHHTSHNRYHHTTTVVLDTIASRFWRSSDPVDYLHYII